MEKRIRAYAYVLYFTIVLGICLIPLFAMGIKKDSVTKENRMLFSQPKIYGQEGFNWSYFQELGGYFEEHFAFRAELVAFDSIIKADIFGVSSVSDVIVGENDWLYYTATLDNFQHKDSISDRMLFNIAHNLALMQSYTEALGKKFLFTVAPNKNSLYEENMPERLSYHVSEESNMERLIPWIEKENVNYVDLFQLFSSQNEILYYKKDSHWNQKGAVMVYNTLLNACDKVHETYGDSEVWITNDYYGDLNLMLFPVCAEPEEYVHYIGGNIWEYCQGESVEDIIVVTECKEGSQNLLMYRDSFGNSLLPLMAGEFSNAVFSKKVPYTMTDLVTYAPDVVILEKVERHLPTLGRIPPVMSAPEVKITDSISVESNTVFDLLKEGSYWKVIGNADIEYMSVDSRIFVEIVDKNGSKVYEAFCTSIDEKNGSSDYGFILYISEVMLEGDILGVKILAETKGQTFLLKESSY